MHTMVMGWLKANDSFTLRFEESKQMNDEEQVALLSFTCLYVHAVMNNIHTM